MGLPRPPAGALLARGVRSPSDALLCCRRGELTSPLIAEPERTDFAEDPKRIGDEDGTFLVESCPRGVFD
jgi:hypothetical protein